MISPSDSDDYHSIFIRNLPLLDLRSPVEVAKGAFPNSTNLPLLDDEQRAAIGTEYGKLGQQAALELGWRMLTPDLKQRRQQQWLDFINANPNGYLYCFRGGLRSQITEQLITEAGGRYPRVVGGYKAMRQFLLQSLETLSISTPLVLVAGRTCSGKTQVIERLCSESSSPAAIFPATSASTASITSKVRALDLEGLAHHRGSAFGAHLQAQPTQIAFDNALAIALLKHAASSASPLLLEDEGKLIGRLALPTPLKNNMRQADIVVVHTPLSQRIEIALQDYVLDRLAACQTRLGEESGLHHFSETLLNNLARIQKRLGGERYYLLRSLFTDAIAAMAAGGSADGFIPGIRTLLTEYYDPMYDFQRCLNHGKVLFEGDIHAVIGWLRENPIMPVATNATATMAEA